MTDTDRTRSGPPQNDASWSDARERSGDWRGWITFAGVMMILLGTFQGIEGLVALLHRGFYAVGPEGLVVNVDYNAWGWLHLVIGLVLVATGLGVMTGQTWARVVGIGLAALSAVVNLAFMAAYPFWSVIVIFVDIVVIYALAVHGRQMRTP
ncbi:membrane protein [Actinomycetospora chibensis]